MPVVITCPACGRKARVPDAMRGLSVRCPACNATFAVAADGPSAAEPVDPVPVVTVVAADDAPARPPIPADADSLRAVRAGAGVQLIAHCSYAAALAAF